jgi:hypothetical protein
MRLKTLLLGSAAAFAVVGGAQAADLSVAEPVEYVKACDAFGAGFYYIPGSDTCLHVFGHVEFDAGFHANAATLPGSSHSASWGFTTAAEAEFDAKSMTDVGVLEGAFGIKGTYDPDSSSNGDIIFDYAWLKLGALKAGHFGSTFNPGGSYVDDFGIANEIKSSLADSNHLELDFKAGSLGLALGIEDPRESFGSALPTDYSLPLIDGNITFGGSNWSGFVSAGYTQLGASAHSSSSWGIDGELTFNIDSANAIRINGAYGDTPYIGGGIYPNVPAGAYGYNDGWSAFASLQHYFSKTLRTDWDLSYIQPVNSGATVTQVGGDLVWLPYAGFKAKVGATWQSTSSTNSWAAQVALRRDW